MPEETSSSPETVEQNAAPVEPVDAIEQVEAEADTSGGFREPHPEVPAEFASHEADPVEPSDAPEPETAAEMPPAPEPEPVRAPVPQREQRREHRQERRPEPPRQKQWVKPADFRPAAPTAITQAVEHATFIAEALKELHDQMDEILELVEVAERQKLADEREIEELRRALRRIQPQRQQQQQPHHHHPQPQRHQPRREEPRRQAPEQREQTEKRESVEQQSGKPAQPAPEPPQPSSPPPAHEEEDLPPHSD